jgi:hypothetical protein
MCGSVRNVIVNDPLREHSLWIENRSGLEINSTREKISIYTFAEYQVWVTGGRDLRNPGEWNE